MLSPALRTQVVLTLAHAMTNPMNSFFTNNELEELNEVNIEELVSSRLEDLAERVAFHAFRGDWETVEVLKAEGLELAEAADSGFNFFYVNDLTNH